jgi:hypothetical protein
VPCRAGCSRRAANQPRAVIASSFVASPSWIGLVATSSGVRSRSLMGRNACAWGELFLRPPRWERVPPPAGPRPWWERVSKVPHMRERRSAERMRAAQPRKRLVKWCNVSAHSCAGNPVADQAFGLSSRANCRPTPALEIPVAGQAFRIVASVDADGPRFSLGRSRGEARASGAQPSASAILAAVPS